LGQQLSEASNERARFFLNYSYVLLIFFFTLFFVFVLVSIFEVPNFLFSIFDKITSHDESEESSESELFSSSLAKASNHFRSSLLISTNLICGLVNLGMRLAEIGLIV